MFPYLGLHIFFWLNLRTYCTVSLSCRQLCFSQFTPLSALWRIIRKVRAGKNVLGHHGECDFLRCKWSFLSKKSDLWSNLWLYFVDQLFVSLQDPAGTCAPLLMWSKRLSASGTLGPVLFCYCFALMLAAQIWSSPVVFDGYISIWTWT